MVPTLNISEGQWNTAVEGVAEYKRRRKKNMKTIPSSFYRDLCSATPRECWLIK